MDGLAFYDYYTEELEHHGILGQKWGHQNGPPYPLDADDHSASERKAGWRKSLSEAAGNASAAIKKKTEEFKVYRAEKAAQNAEKKRIKAEEAEKKRIEDEAAAAEKHAADKASAIRSGDPTLVAQFASEMTIQEYREAVDRLNLANQVNKYLPPEEAKLTLTQRVSNFADNVNEKVETYNKIANLTNLFFKTDLPVLNESALDRAKKEAEKKKKEEEEAEKKIIEQYQNRVKLMTADKQLRDLQEYEDNRETAKEVKSWQDKSKISAAKETLAKNADAAEKRRVEAENKAKAAEKERQEKEKLNSDWDDAIKVNREVDRANLLKNDWTKAKERSDALSNDKTASQYEKDRAEETARNAEAAYNNQLWRSKQSPAALDSYDASVRQLNAETANRSYTNISKDAAAASLTFNRALDNLANLPDNEQLFRNLD